MLKKWQIVFSFFVVANVSLALEINTDEMKAIDSFVERFQERTKRPKACPLLSKNYADLVTRLDSIKNIFKDSCITSSDGRIAELVSSFESLQNELVKQNVVEQKIEDKFTQVTNLNLPSLLTNLKTIIKKRQCNLEDGRVLDTVADFIYDATQFGLVAGTQEGAMVAGKGFIVSSALKLIDLIFHERFNFENATDRQTFIKLNCSFYDVRSQLESAGILEVENKTAREDFNFAKDNLEKVKDLAKKLETEKASALALYAKLDDDKMKESTGNVRPLKDMLVKIKAALDNSHYTFSAMTDDSKKLLTIYEVSKNYDLLVAQIAFFKTTKLSAIPLLDDTFLNDLKRFNSLEAQSFNQLMATPTKEFNEVIKPEILFHTLRILGEIEEKENEIRATLVETKKALDKKLMDQIEANIKRVNFLTNIKDRLEKIVSAKTFSALDDGSENALNILEDYKSISNLIYGEWGDKFLKFIATKSSEEFSKYSEYVKKYNDQYGMINDVSLRDPKGAYICQDAQRIRISYKYAESVAEEGYDFIVTNKDLFYSDVKNHYNFDTSEVTPESSSFILGPVENIQKHYFSTLLAVRQMRGEKIESSFEKSFLSEARWGKNQYLGRTILDVYNSRSILKSVQAKYEKLKCERFLKEDLLD